MTLIIRMLVLLAAVGIPTALVRAPVPEEPDAMPAGHRTATEVVIDAPGEPGRHAAAAGQPAEPEPTPTIVPTPAVTPTPTPFVAWTPAPTTAPQSAWQPTPAPTQQPRAVATAAPAPRSTPPPTAPPNSSYNREQVKQQIREAWSGDGDEAVEVVGCETGGTYDPRSYNPSGPFYGLWQFNQDTWERYGGSGDPRDASPARQTQVAWRVYSERGWAPWPSCGPNG